MRYGNRWGNPGRGTWLPTRLGYTAGAQGSRREVLKGTTVLFHAKDHTEYTAQPLAVPSPLSSLSAAPTGPSEGTASPSAAPATLAAPGAPPTLIKIFRLGYSQLDAVTILAGPQHRWRGCPRTSPEPAGLPLPIASHRILWHPISHAPRPISQPVPPEDAVCRGRQAR